MNRVRTLKEAYNTIKAEDKDTSISYTLIRRLVLDKKVPTMKSGKKYLVDMDALIRYINEEMLSNIQADVTQDDQSNIKPIAENMRRKSR